MLKFYKEGNQNGITTKYNYEKITVKNKKPNKEIDIKTDDKLIYYKNDDITEIAKKINLEYKKVQDELSFFDFLEKIIPVGINFVDVINIYKTCLCLMKG